ncbi:hypothetical protein LCGC14_2952900 [marine sediment metagenome]|uniref:HTH arsR-type domain-containing protein n=1 Tax=marine sediment metagenome TaxID=412755 RepID=A0A0F8Y1W5_9ZZZZ
MSQSEVNSLLRANKNHWFSVKRISEILDIGVGSVARNLRRMRQSNMVEYKTIHNKYLYKYKTTWSVLK